MRHPLSQFTVQIEACTGKTKAPALQSFAYALYQDPKTKHDYWLLFGGRTNPASANADSAAMGGLHQAVDYNGSRTDTGNTSTNNDYAYHSFPMASFNQSIYAYDVDADNLASVDVGKFLNLLPAIPTTSFISVNTLARQYDSTLYVAGGYGPATMKTPSLGDTVTYLTSGGLLRINVPSVIRCVTGQGCVPKLNDIRYGTNPQIVSTGGELHKIGDSFYIAGGQHYRELDKLITQDSDVVVYDQKLIYLTSVVPFAIASNMVNPLLLDITVDPTAIITDVPLDKLNTEYADSLSRFRRRDVVIAPTFIGDTSTSGFVFHGGVFRPSASSQNPGAGPFRAWDDALIIQPTLTKRYSFSTDTAVYNSYNVYSCPNFVGYNDSTQSVHTFLMGGIGDGVANYWVSGFTHSVTQTIQPLGNPTGITAIPDSTGFLIDGTSQYYGAEAAFIYKTDPRLVFMQNNEEILNLKATLPQAGDSIQVGYIYGGIEADTPNPGGYKGRMTRATNRIFKVTLKRNW